MGSGLMDHDGHVGWRLERLEQLGIAGNTIVIYTTGNGPESSTWPHAGVTKVSRREDTTWEGGAGALFLVRWLDRIRADLKRNGISSHEDVLPDHGGSHRPLNVAEDLWESHNVLIDGVNSLDYWTGQADQSTRNHTLARRLNGPKAPRARADRKRGDFRDLPDMTPSQGRYILINKLILTGAAALTTIIPFANAQQSVTTDAGTIDRSEVARFFNQPGYSPYAGRNYPAFPLWGEQHLHTSWSADAIAGGTRVGPDEALRYAKGAEITSSTGQPVKLSRPYDWMVVADHSDALGVMSGVLEGDPALMADPTLKEWNKGMNAGGEKASAVVMEIITLQGQGGLPEAMTDPDVQFDMWRKMTEIVEGHNDPGTFSAIIGYEWTSNYGGGNNLHRNVIYRDGKALADRVRPLTTFDTEIPNELWDWMANYEESAGGRLLAIPHNGNLSNGLMFATETPDGKPIDAEWAMQRQRWEPLYEVTQSKGTSEQHPSLAPSDEFLDFEIWDKGNLNVVPKEPGMIEYEYAREALKRGLKLEEEFGANPFKFGLVGSTDDHTGVSSAEENNFFGKFPSSEPGPERSTGNAFDFEGRTVKDWQLGASGLTAVWAKENSRAAIWDAMKRKEVYGTTGTRMSVRFFGGWDFVASDAQGRNPGAIGYGKGVPMGGDLPPAPQSSQAPSFLVAALKDPLSGNLDRIQVIKGWLDASGDTQEKVYDVVWSGDREPGADGKLTAVGDTVDVENAIWTNTIGAPELITVWTDPDFDPSLKAFYYARVIEIPTPRWTTYDAAYYKEVEFGPEVPMTVTERAYTSPIWYAPQE